MAYLIIWIFETLRLWNFETKKPGNLETKKPRNQETEKPRHRLRKSPLPKTIWNQQNAAKQRKAAATNTRILTPGTPTDKDHDRHALTQLCLARTHDMHETKTETKRSRSPSNGTDKLYELPYNSDEQTNPKTSWELKMTTKKELEIIYNALGKPCGAMHHFPKASCHMVICPGLVPWNSLPWNNDAIEQSKLHHALRYQTRVANNGKQIIFAYQAGLDKSTLTTQQGDRGARWINKVSKYRFAKSTPLLSNLENIGFEPGEGGPCFLMIFDRCINARMFNDDVIHFLNTRKLWFHDFRT